MGSTNNNILPASTGLNLGSPNQRWNSFLQNADIAGSIAGNPTFSGNVSARSLNGAVNAAEFAGSDIGAQVNAAIASLPTGGTVYIPASATPYVQSTTIVCPRNIKLCGASGYGTILSFAPTGGWAVVIADGMGAATYPEGGIEDLTLQGPGSGTIAGGIYIGGSDGVGNSPSVGINPGTNFGDHVNFNRVRIYNFGTGIQFGMNAWSELFFECLISGNSTGIAFPNTTTNSGEKIVFIGCSIQNGAVGVSLAAGGTQVDVDFYFTNCSFDFNSSWAIRNSNTAFAITLTGCHIEQHTNWLQTFGFCQLIGCYFTNGSSSGTLGYLIDNQATTFLVLGGGFFNSGTGNILNPASAASNWIVPFATGTGSSFASMAAAGVKTLIDYLGNLGTSNLYVNGAVNTNLFLQKAVTGYQGIVTTRNGVASQVASYSTPGIGNNAALGTTVLYTVPVAADQVYRLSWEAKVITAAGTSSTAGPLIVSWTTPDSQNISATGSANTGAGSFGTAQTGNTNLSIMTGVSMVLNCKKNTNINFTFGYASNAAAAMFYDLNIILELM